MCGVGVYMLSTKVLTAQRQLRHGRLDKHGGGNFPSSAGFGDELLWFVAELTSCLFVLSVQLFLIFCCFVIILLFCAGFVNLL